MIKEDIIFYIGYINYIGGVETWIHEIAKIYGKNRNIVVMYKWIAPKQLDRLEKYIKTIKYTGQRVNCNKLVFCYDHSAVKTTTAKEYILTIHADYKAQNIKITIPKETTSIYAVSQLAKQSFQEVYKDQLKKLKLNVEVLYNPLTIDKPKRVLTLISPTRLTKEKGGSRIIAMAKRLKEKGIPYNWFVYSDRTIDCDTSHFVMMQPELDIRDYIADADYLVQLSDTEGYAYSIIEALAVGTPVVITPLPIKDEMKCNEGNSIILDFDLKNIDEVIDKMCNSNLKGFKYKKKESNEEYLKILGKPTKSNYVYERDRESVRLKEPKAVEYKEPIVDDGSSVKIKVLRPFNDTFLGKYVKRNDEYIMTMARAKQIMQTLPLYIRVLNKVERR